MDTHTLTEAQVRRLLEDVDAYQLARFGDFTFYIRPSGELDYDANSSSITERIGQLNHQLPGLITVIRPVPDESELWWSLTDAGREHLARLRALVHAVDPTEDPYALCGYDTRGDAELPRRTRITCTDCLTCMTGSARAWQCVLRAGYALRTLIGGSR